MHWYLEHDVDFPEPLARIGKRGLYVWYWPDIEEWARQKGRLPARRRRR